MKKWGAPLLILVVFALFVVARHVADVQGNAISPYEAVNPFIGTAAGGQTVPVVGEPFAMTGWTPETQPTEAKCVPPYLYTDTRLTGIRASHWMSGSCTQDYGSVTLMPTTGALRPQPTDRAAPFSHSDESAHPAFYSVRLPRYGETVAVTAGIRAGMIRVSYAHAGWENLIVEPNARFKDGWVRVDLARREIIGYNPVHRIYQGNGKPTGFRGYFVVQFRDRPAEAGTWCDATLDKQMELSGEGRCRNMGAYIRFHHRSGDLIVKVGTSFTSIEAARANLQAEIPGWSFDTLEKHTREIWEHALASINITGSREQRRIFYTALYHSLLMPRTASDANGDYPGFAENGRVEHMTHGTYYADFSLWDTFRAEQPLLTLIQPGRDQQMVESLVLKGEQGGYLPIFPAWGSYTSEMIGDHGVAVIADAYAKGLRNFDVDAAWKLIWRNATQTPPEAQYKNGLGLRALKDYLRLGYIPLENPVPDAFHRGEQVSRTLAYAYDDAVASHMASLLGHRKEAEELARRGGFWRNVFDPQTKFVRGRHANGTWITPFDPSVSQPYITEGNPWQYTFFVPQDIPGLIQAMGGPEAFRAKLDGLFRRGLYDQGNEPSHDIAYLYDGAGFAWLTQRRIPALRALYTDTPEGLPGNDDAGQMSAWYIFSAIGFYPVCPGLPEYWIGTPLYSYVTLHTGNGAAFTIDAQGAGPGRPYIQQATLNGKALTSPVLTQAQITHGGMLKLVMGAYPNKRLWSSVMHDAKIPPVH